VRTLLELLEHATGRDLRVRRDLVDVEHRLAACVERTQDGLPFVARPGQEDLLDRFVRRRVLGELLIDKVGALERRAERRPELRLERADAVVAPVTAAIHAVARVAAREPLIAPRDLLARA